jgi:hypothetical protein
MKMNSQLKTALIAAFIAAIGMDFALAQQSPAKSPPAKSAPGQALKEQRQFDAYDPSKRLRNSRQSCMRDEEHVGAYCAKKCQPGYQMEIKDNFATCRSLTPLPPGVMPGPRHKETGIQPEPPKSEKQGPGRPGA